MGEIWKILRLLFASVGFCNFSLVKKIQKSDEIFFILFKKLYTRQGLSCLVDNFIQITVKIRFFALYK